MKRIGPELSRAIQVEPLDDERWTNIERAVVIGATDAAARTSVRTSRGGLALAFGGAMLVVVIAAGLVGWKLRGGTAEAPAVATVDEVAPLSIDTSDRGSTIDIGDATIVSDPATAFVVTRPDGGVLVTMARGKVELDVAKRGTRAPLVVRAGETDVIVVGTRFSVDFGDGTGSAIVHVTEGVVKVVHAAQETRVTANQQWSRERGLVAATPVAVAVAPKSTAGGSAFETRDDAPEVLHERHSIVPESKLSTTGIGSAVTRPKQPVAGGPELRTRPTTTVPGSEPMKDLKTAIRQQKLLPPLDVGALHPNDAMAQYRARLMTKEASYAMYSMAHLYALKLGRTSEALSTLDGYIRRFSKNDKEYSDALWLRVRILCLRNIDDRCRQAAYTVVHQSDNGEVRRLAELIVIQR